MVPKNKGGLPRFLEVLMALAGLAVLSPFLLAGAIAVRFGSKGPVFFKQERLGRKGKPFVLYKFRSMRLENQGTQVTAKGDSRITRVGRLLRKTKLDELPELWNVIRGDLSLVGPRPEVPRYVDLKDPLWQMVLENRPGITDPVTLKLRNEEELLARVEGSQEDFYLKVLQPLKLKGYAEYQEKRNGWTDTKILWKSVMAVLFPGRNPPPTIKDICREAEKEAAVRSCPK